MVKVKRGVTLVELVVMLVVLSTIVVVLHPIVFYISQAFGVVISDRSHYQNLRVIKKELENEIMEVKVIENIGNQKFKFENSDGSKIEYRLGNVSSTEADFIKIVDGSELIVARVDNSVSSSVRFKYFNRENMEETDKDEITMVGYSIPVIARENKTTVFGSVPLFLDEVNYEF